MMWNQGYPINWAAPLNRGLLSWWLRPPTLVSNARWLDLCGRNHGTLVNEPTWSGNTRLGGWGGMTFDASNDYVSAPAYAASVFAASEASVCWWAKCFAVNAPYGTPFTLQDPGAFNTHFPYEDGLMYVSIFDSTRVVNGLAPPVSLTQWVHFCLTSAAGTNNYKLYFNGLNTNNYTRGTFDVSSAINIGRSDALGGAFYWGGSVDDIRLYPRVLAADEVAGLSQASKTGYKRELSWIEEESDWPRPAGRFFPPWPRPRFQPSLGV